LDACLPVGLCSFSSDHSCLISCPLDNVYIQVVIVIVRTPNFKYEGFGFKASCYIMHLLCNVLLECDLVLAVDYVSFKILV
jgi:hypothetical protein